MKDFRAILWFVAVVAGAVAASGCRVPAAKERVVGPVDYGLSNAVPPFSFNIVNVYQLYNADDGTLAYVTGGIQQRDSGAQADSSEGADIDSHGVAPVRIVAERSVGAVTIRMRAGADFGDIAAADRYAAQVAEGVHSATTTVWPAEPVALLADIHIMPVDASYSLGRRVNWKQGDPFRLALFATDLSRIGDDTAHELYHVLAARWSIGSKGVRAQERGNAAFAFEEVAAGLYGRCAVLLGKGSVSLQNHEFTVVLNNRRLQVPLSKDDVRHVLDMLRASDANPQPTGPGLGIGTSIGTLLGNAVRHSMSEAAASAEIEVSSAEGQRLLSLCREFSPDPMRLEAWLQETDLATD